MTNLIYKIIWKVWSWITRWAEVAGRIWAAYWLLILGSFLIVGSLVLRWVMFPFSRNIVALKLPLLGLPGVLPHFHLLSYGTLALGFLAAGWFLRNRFRPSLALAAALLLTLWALVPGRMAFEQSALLRRLVEEDQAVPVVKAFTRDFFPQNYGTAEEIPKRLDVVTLFGRFVGAVSFLGLGWYCFGFGSFLVAIYALGRLPGERTFPSVAIVCLPLGALVILSLPPLLGQHYFNKATVARAAGQNEEAIADYRNAMRWDSWHGDGIDVYNLIGQLQKQAGLAEGSAERAISRAVDLKDASQFEQAIFDFERAAETGKGALAQAARRAAARTRMDLGIACYRAGAIGPAVLNWEQALAEDPYLVYTLPFLIRGNFDLSRYQAAIDLDDKLLKIVADHDSLLADAYSLGADAYTKLGRDSDARRYYSLSLVADSMLNHWALTGMVGD